MTDAIGFIGLGAMGGSMAQQPKDSAFSHGTFVEVSIVHQKVGPH